MNHLLNTLFVTTPGAYVGKDHETVAVKVDGEVKLSVPFHLLGGIVCFGRISVSPMLLGECGERGIGLSFLTEEGRFQARVEGRLSTGAVLRRAQYAAADNERGSTVLARGFVAGKIANARSVLQRAAREPDNDHRDEIERAVDALWDALHRVEQANTTDILRGVEGDAAATYFGVFGALIRRPGFSFLRRTRRPPLDPVNALLSFLYALLTHDVSSALQAVGLDPAVGYLHSVRSGRPSLALDLVEEFRPIFADRLALTLINLQQVTPEGFRQDPSGGVRMDEPTRKQVLVAYQKRKQETVVHPLLKTECTFGMVPHLQARLLARVIRGDLDAYPPYVTR